MKKFTKTLIAFSLCITLWGSQFCIANAEEVPDTDTEITSETGETENNEVEYDMEKGGAQVFHFTEENGDSAEVVIEEVPSELRVSNGTYKISKTIKNKWIASFYIDVNSNKITRAYNKSCKALVGKITTSSLIKNSSSKATLTFSIKYSTAYVQINMVASIKNKKIVTSIK